MKAWEYLSGWTSFGLPSNLQKRLYQFLLRKAIGQFVQNDLDNFDVDLKNGYVELRKVELNLKKLNDILNGIPLLLERGQVESIQISMPWSNLSSGDVYLKIQSINIDLVPTNEINTDLRMEEPSILSSSLHFADDFLKSQVEDDELKQSIDDLQSEPMEGLEILTRMIDKILSRFKIDIFDTNIRIIHDESAVPLTSCEYEQENKKYALELCIPQISYFDETPEFDVNSDGQTDNRRHMEDSSIMLPPVCRETIKIIAIKSPTIWLISLQNNNMKYHDDDDDSINDQSKSFLNMNYSLENTQFYEVEQGNSMILDENEAGSTSTPKANDRQQPYRSLLLTTVDKDNWIRIKQLNNSLPIKQLDIFITHARVTITPKQLTFLVDLLGSMTGTQQTSVPPQRHSKPVDMHASSYSSTESTYLSPSPQDTKIKLQVSLAEFFFLDHETSVEKDDCRSFENTNHVRLHINNFNTRLQQVFKKDVKAFYTIIDLNISNMALDEWIIKPIAASNFTFYGSSNQKLFQTKYNTYTSIIEFNDDVKHAYNKTELFPTYADSNNVLKNEKQVVRVRIEKRQSNLHDRFTDDSLYDEDITVDIQAFKLNINPQLVNRLENYMYAFKYLNKPQDEDKGYFDKQLSEQAVYEDLGLQTRKNNGNKRMRLKMAFIRILLSVPDMSHVCIRNDFNDRFHSDQLSLDISSLDGIWDDQVSTDTLLGSEIYTGALKPRPIKFTITLDYVNVFLKLYDDDLARCWFTAKSTPVSFDDIQQPTIVISVQDLTNISSTDASSNFLNYLFNHINNKERNKREQHGYIPIEEQVESVLSFKKYALQNSMFQINCHIPTSNINLSKKSWDKIQILQNDILLWQPNFIQSPNFDQSYDSTSGSSNQYSTAESTSFSNEKILYSNNFFSLSAILSQSTWYLQYTDIFCYRIEFTEFQYFSVIKHLGQNENITILDIDDLSLDDISFGEKKLIHKAIPNKTNDKRNIPMVSLISRLSLFLESNFQHKDSSITLNQLCWEAIKNLEIDFVDHITDFQKIPQEMVFINPVIQRSKVYVHLLDSYIEYMPEHSPSRGALFLDGLEVITTIMPSQPFIDIALSIQNTDLLLIDDQVELKKPASDQKFKSSLSSKEYLEIAGFLSILKLQNIYTKIKIKLDEHKSDPKLDIQLSSTDIYLSTCTDSFQTLINLVTYISNEKKADTTDTRDHNKTPPYVVQSNLDMFASMDENTFNKNKYHTIPLKKDEPQIIYVEEYFKKDKNENHHHNIPPEKPFRKRRIRKHDERIRVLSEDKEHFQIVDNFYEVDKNTNDIKNESNSVKPLYVVQITNVNFKWNLYDGYDWDYLRADMASVNHTKRRQEKITEHTQSGFGDEIGGDSSTKPYSFTKNRHLSKSPSMEIILKSLSVDLKLMYESDPTSTYLDLRIKDLEILDNIKTSKWNKFLGYMRSNNLKIPRETHSCMVNIELIGLRPIQGHPEDQEHRLKVELLPIRLFIDQDALYFLIKYFTFDPSYLRSTIAITPDLTVLSNRQNKKKEMFIFFQFVYIHPIVLKIDYKAKHIDYGKIKEGRFAELANLINLDGAQIKLNRIKMTGIKGWDGLLEKLGEEWITHIKNTQIGSMISGITPIRPVVNLSKGASDIVRLPIQQYRKDGRIMSGLSKGTQSFARATTIELIKLSSKVASGTQVALEHADGFFSSNNTSEASSSSSYNNQDDFHFTYTDIYGGDISNDDEDFFKESGSSSKKHASFNYHEDLVPNTKSIYGLSNDQNNMIKNYSGSSNDSISIKSTKSTSSSIIKPLINLTSAFQTILTGLRNSIDPVTRIQNEDKYKRFK